MQFLGRPSTWAPLFLGICIGLIAASPSQAQLREGFDTTVEALATGEELQAQSNLWVLEVDLKTVRMVRTEITDPDTGEKKPEIIWYLVYRAVNRDLERRTDNSDTRPLNTNDEQPQPLFIPELTLVTDDNGVQRIYDDVILPEAQEAIVRRERRELKNSVEIVGPIPPMTPWDSDKKDAIYGVAMWRGITTETDFFSVYLTGFSNGYQIQEGPDGEPVVWRKTIVQNYWRPGDEFNPNEEEIRTQGEPRWIYRPDDDDSFSLSQPVDPADAQRENDDSANNGVQASDDETE